MSNTDDEETALEDLAATPDSELRVIGSTPEQVRAYLFRSIIKANRKRSRPINDFKLRAMPLDTLLNRYEQASYERNEYPDPAHEARWRAYRQEVERRITPLAGVDVVVSSEFRDGDRVTIGGLTGDTGVI